MVLGDYLLNLFSTDPEASLSGIDVVFLLGLQPTPEFTI